MKKLSVIILSVILIALSLSPAAAQPFTSPFVSPIHSGGTVHTMGYQRGPQAQRKEKAIPAYLDPLINPWAFLFIRGSK